MDKSKKGSHGGNGKSSLLGKDFGEVWLSWDPVLEPHISQGAPQAALAAAGPEAGSPKPCPQLPVHLRAWRGSRNLIKPEVLPQKPQPIASLGIQHHQQLWILPGTHPRVPNPTGTLTAPFPLQHPLPCTSRAWLGFQHRQETPWKCLLALLPLPAAKKGSKMQFRSQNLGFTLKNTKPFYKAECWQV